jgi:hypothetical protein
VRFRYASPARFFYRSLLLLLVALAASAQAEWKIVSAETEPGGGGIDHRHVVVEDATAGQRVAVDVAVFSAKSTALHVIDNPDGQSLGAVMKRENCVCGVNGGYFDTEFKPIGLRVADGTTFSPLRRARLITESCCSRTEALTSCVSVNFLARKKSSPQFNPDHFSSKATSAFAV